MASKMHRKASSNVFAVPPYDPASGCDEWRSRTLEQQVVRCHLGFVGDITLRYSGKPRSGPFSETAYWATLPQEARRTLICLGR